MCVEKDFGNAAKPKSTTAKVRTRADEATKAKPKNDENGTSSLGWSNLDRSSLGWSNLSRVLSARGSKAAVAREAAVARQAAVVREAAVARQAAVVREAAFTHAQKENFNRRRQFCESQKEKF